MRPPLTLIALPLLLAPMGSFAQGSPADAYRAHGSRPGWTLVIGKARMRYANPRTRERIEIPLPRPIIGINGELYRSERLTVDATHVRCTDRAGRVWRDTVRVTTRRGQVSGCGGEAVGASAIALADTRWTIQSVNGNPVRLKKPTELRFTARRIEGNAGCNGFGGAYDVTRGTLVAHDIVSTMMYCDDGSAVEREVFAVLRAPAQLNRRGPTMTLENAAGTVELSRID